MSTLRIGVGSFFTGGRSRCRLKYNALAESTFPDCARHLDRPTEWKLVRNDDRIPRASELPDSKKRCA